MPNDGAAGYAIKELFKTMNYEVSFQYYPIRRAKAETLKGDEIWGFVPCSENDVIPGLVLSDGVFQTTTLIIENKEKPISWNKPEDLGKYKGSNGRGYSLKNPMKGYFDKGILKIEESPDDVSGLLKVASKRLDYHFIADGMYKFLIAKDPKLKAVASSLQVNPKPAAHVFWGICFKEKDPRSMQVLKELNASSEKKNFQTHVAEYVKKIDAMSAVSEKKKDGK